MYVGDGQLKYYAVSGDSMIKTGNLLQAAKESYEKFIDHVWLPSNAGLHKMVMHYITQYSLCNIVLKMRVTIHTYLYMRD